MTKVGYPLRPRRAWRVLFFCVLALLMVFSVSAVSAKTVLVYGTTERVTDMDPANAYDFHTWEVFTIFTKG